MSKLFELLTELANRNGTGYNANLCTLEVSSYGTAQIRLNQMRVLRAGDESELVAKLAAYLANKDQITQPHKVESLITNWKDDAKPEVKEFSTEAAAIDYCDRVSEMPCFVYARVYDPNGEDIYEVQSNTDDGDGMDTNEAKANDFHAMY